MTADERELYRFAAYELIDGEPVMIAATPKLDGVGLMLATLATDRLEHGEQTQQAVAVPVVGLLDRQERRWITSLWHPQPTVIPRAQG